MSNWCRKGSAIEMASSEDGTEEQVDSPGLLVYLGYQFMKQRCMVPTCPTNGVDNRRLHGEIFVDDLQRLEN